MPSTRTAEPLLRITAPHFCAGAVVGPDGRIRRAAPILRWTVGRCPRAVWAWARSRGYRPERVG